MSRKNKVNPDYYKVAGRLAPDDLARERMKQGMAKTAKDRDERMKGSTGRTDEADAAVPSSMSWPDDASRSAKGRAKTLVKKSVADTKKKLASTRSVATKPARRTAAGKKTFGTKRTSPATR
jgi:hypothetical protein